MTAQVYNFNPPKGKREWLPITPVPDDAPAPPVNHYKHGEPNFIFRYNNLDKKLMCLYCRFKRAEDGVWLNLPLSYCRHVETGKEEWRWIALAEPRPLFIESNFGQWRDGMPKLVVGTEEAVGIATMQLNELYDAVTWPQDARSVKKADWSWFKEGDEVVIWPDCNSIREPITKEELDAGMKPEDKPFLPAIKQSGIAAAETVAQILQARGCKVRIVDVPAPGVKPDGWNIMHADDEMSVEEIKTFITDHLRAPIPLNERGISTAILANAGEWKEQLFYKDGLVRECRENVYLILQHHPDWKGVLWRDEFSNRIICRRDSPIGKLQGSEWLEEDDFKLGLWLAQNLRLFIKASSNLADGIRAEADQNKFHPVREHLDSLVWDGKDRLEDWLSDYVGVEKSPYTSLVARYFLIGMVARIYRPGCKMDTALILEGIQGEGKSTLAKILAGDEHWFSDTVFVMGEKDSLQGLRGRWVYELAELDSFGKAESTRAKAFISSSTDSYRAPYDRTFKDHPRQCVFIGTTNQIEYFKDPSGNRRYWPVKSNGEVKLDAMRQVRDQLFAEAVQWFKNDMHWWPTRDEQINLFLPEQEQRELEDPWSKLIYDWLNSHSLSKVTVLDILLDAVGVEKSKIDGNKQMSTRVGICMRKLAWQKHRETSGAREYYYARPEKPKKEGSDDPLPF
ncbi:MAG: hypothetical protein B7Y56_03105 [Gallionellales bacterium 35-53-114]|jgi:predicted P-loop ATPase|nr:MAG: hypothetical protein B7Y56_03105 [Gallionellales bacterium 35-53-114]OYZ65096.1 MAG: hypothetical protein B7Y04_00265 [Gallionellales bacterium 24-53-125]OZB08005.1 MAG: hypothetical protein B7X61_10715 [Gallionellales bacterium 39-52-133]HQS59746.1 VapE family protein [Gallionellaceae bacterium]HQS76500.1 VapE family protein [Gallionellaceae bacterium]